MPAKKKPVRPKKDRASFEPKNADTSVEGEEENVETIVPPGEDLIPDSSKMAEDKENSTEEKNFWKEDEQPVEENTTSEPEPKPVVGESTDDSEPQELSFLKDAKKSGPTLSKLIWIVAAVALFVGGIGGGVLIYKEGVEKGKKEAMVAEPSPSPIVEATSEPTPVFSRAETDVLILNGSGTPGAGQKAREFLEGLGYKVVKVSNAKSFNYDKTELAMKLEIKENVNQIIEDISAKYEVNEEAIDTSWENSEYDLQVIIGKDLADSSE